MPSAARGPMRQFARVSGALKGGPRGLARRGFFNLASQFTPVVAVNRQGLRFYVSTSDRVLSRRLFVNDRRPERDIQHAVAVLRQIDGPTLLESSAVVEVGANIGTHTVELLRRYGARSVTAIEPDPDNFALLQQNVLANGVIDRVIMLQLALSDHDGVAELELAVGDSGDHRVRVPSSPTQGRETLRRTIQVRAARFDSLVDHGEIDLDSTGLIWMDAQGHEAHILRAATYVLNSEIPIVMEYWPYGLRRAGGLETLHELISNHYRYVIDLGAVDVAAPRVISADHIPRLEEENGWNEYVNQGSAGTDLVLGRNITPNLGLTSY